MTMKIITIGLAVLLIAGLVWVFYPAHLSATTHAFPQSSEEYIKLKSKLILAVKTNNIEGIYVQGNESDPYPLDISCNEAPLLTLVRHNNTTLVMIYSGIYSRYPDVDKMLGELRAFFPAIATKIAPHKDQDYGGLEQFILKYRDDVDVLKTCK
jgi:hypothetical protein